MLPPLPVARRNGPWCCNRADCCLARFRNNPLGDRHCRHQCRGPCRHACHRQTWTGESCFVENGFDPHSYRIAKPQRAALLTVQEWTKVRISLLYLTLFAAGCEFSWAEGCKRWLCVEPIRTAPEPGCSGAMVLLVFDCILQPADASYIHFDNVAITKPDWRRSGCPDTAGRAGGNYIARQ